MLARIPRSPVPEIGVQIDGRPATLVDVSCNGAQVVSPRSLKPGQRVRVLLAAGPPPLRLAAAVAWATLEVSAGVPRYRAGLTFADADAGAIAPFIARITGFGAER